MPTTAAMILVCGGCGLRGRNPQAGRPQTAAIQQSGTEPRHHVRPGTPGTVVDAATVFFLGLMTMGIFAWVWWFRVVRELDTFEGGNQHGQLMKRTFFRAAIVLPGATIGLLTVFIFMMVGGDRLGNTVVSGVVMLSAIALLLGALVAILVYSIKLMNDLWAGVLRVPYTDEQRCGIQRAEPRAMLRRMWTEYFMMVLIFPAMFIVPWFGWAGVFLVMALGLLSIPYSLYVCYRIWNTFHATVSRINDLWIRHGATPT